MDCLFPRRPLPNQLITEDSHTSLRFFSCFSSLGIASIAPLQADHEEPCRDLLGGWGLGVARGWLVDKPS